MIAYYLTNTNSYTIRTENTSSNAFIMSLQDMYTQVNTTASLSGISFIPYENIFGFTASINDAYVGQEFRASLLNSGSDNPIWNGTIQIYAGQTIDKPTYKTQNDSYLSYTSDNEYIILTPPTPPTTTTTTIAPPTTTTSTTTVAPTTSTTTLGPTTSTTTLSPGTIDAELFFKKQAGGMGFDVCVSGSKLTSQIDGIVITDYNLFMSSDNTCSTPYGTTWSLAITDYQVQFIGNESVPCTSGGDISSGNYYRSRVSGSLYWTFGLTGSSQEVSFDISGSGYQDVTNNGRTVRVYGAGCVLNDATPGC